MKIPIFKKNRDYSQYINQDINKLDGLEKGKKYADKNGNWRIIVGFDENGVFWENIFGKSGVCITTHFKKIYTTILNN